MPDSTERMEASQKQQEKLIDAIMGRLLQVGVSVAATIVFAGGVLYLTRHSTPTINYRSFQSEPGDFRTIPGIFHEALARDGRGLIQLGLLLLIATPVARVAYSVIAFLYERDWKYVGFTLIVLSLLLYSLMQGR